MTRIYITWAAVIGPTLFCVLLLIARKDMTAVIVAAWLLWGSWMLAKAVRDEKEPNPPCPQKRH